MLLGTIQVFIYRIFFIMFENPIPSILPVDGSVSTMWDETLWSNRRRNRRLSKKKSCDLHPPVIPALVSKVMPGVKVIVILRDPVTRSVQSSRSSLETMSHG